MYKELVMFKTSGIDEVNGSHIDIYLQDHIINISMTKKCMRFVNKCFINSIIPKDKYNFTEQDINILEKCLLNVSGIENHLKHTVDKDDKNTLINQLKHFYVLFLLILHKYYMYGVIEENTNIKVKYN